jgi:hypothetical protein
LALDHIVHINNGSGAAKPIVLRLLPGEETIFNLKILNDGEPSNISLLASSPVFKAVRLKKPDHYVVLEEIIPILARMPADKKRLDGEILLSSSSGESRVPITLLRDSEDPGDDLEDPGLRGDKELKDDEVDEDDEDVDLAGRQSLGRNRDDADDEDNDSDYEDDYERVKRIDDEDEDEDENEVAEKEPRRIAFSREKDLQRYRSATRRQRAGGIESNGEKRSQKPAKSLVDEDRSDTDDDDNSRIENRSRARIDDRFVDPVNRQDDAPRFIRRQVPLEEPEKWKEERNEERKQEWAEERQEERAEERMRPNSGYEDRYQAFRRGFESEVQEIPTSAAQTAADTLADRQESIPEEPEAYARQDEETESIYLDRLGSFGGMGSLKVIPVVLFLALVIVLVMTFITQNIPEFPGALASSILIVTLIIYGAATLLKA